MCQGVKDTCMRGRAITEAFSIVQSWPAVFFEWAFFFPCPVISSDSVHVTFDVSPCSYCCRRKFPIGDNGGVLYCKRKFDSTHGFSSNCHMTVPWNLPWQPTRDKNKKNLYGLAAWSSDLTGTWMCLNSWFRTISFFFKLKGGEVEGGCWTHSSVTQTGLFLMYFTWTVTGISEEAFKVFFFQSAWADWLCRWKVSLLIMLWLFSSFLCHFLAFYGSFTHSFGLYILCTLCFNEAWYVTVFWYWNCLLLKKPSGLDFLLCSVCVCGCISSRKILWAAFTYACWRTCAFTSGNSRFTS